LFKACLASIPIYLMFVIKILKWTIDIINSHMSIFSVIICQTRNHYVKRRNMGAWVFLI
jgi:hypothetical protein